MDWWQDVFIYAIVYPEHRGHPSLAADGCCVMNVDGGCWLNSRTYCGQLDGCRDNVLAKGAR